MQGNLGNGALSRPPFVDPRKVPFVRIASRGELPHLYKPGCTYFITFRLADAVTFDATATTEQSKLDADEDDMSVEEICRINEPPLRLGSCLLNQSAIAELVQNALVHFHTQRYWVREWTIMPNHVHVVVTPFKGYSASSVLHSWKSFTAKEANRLLGRKGTFWERESFDHICRRAEQVTRFSQYVRENPVEAMLVDNASDWSWGSASVRNSSNQFNGPLGAWRETEGNIQVT